MEVLQGVGVLPSEGRRWPIFRAVATGGGGRRVSIPPVPIRQPGLDRPPEGYYPDFFTMPPGILRLSVEPSPFGSGKYCEI
jgi:hypothetical protein